ncbi:MAG: PAS domain-containing protein [Tagaea sp.]
MSWINAGKIDARVDLIGDHRTFGAGALEMKIDPQGERDAFRRAVVSDGIRPLAEQIVGGDYSTLAQRLPKDRERLPTIVLNPSQDFLVEPRHRSLLSYWRANSTSDAPMRRSALDPIALRDVMGYLLLLHADETGLDFEFRVYGTEIAQIAGRDWTGWTVGAMSLKTRSQLGDFYRAVYVACALSRQPIFTEHDSPPWLSAKSWRRLIVPLIDDAGAPSWFLVANQPYEIRPLGNEAHALRERILG